MTVPSRDLGAPLRVRTSDGRVVSGIADGVAADGGLLLRNRLGVQSVHSGTVIRNSRRSHVAAVAGP